MLNLWTLALDELRYGAIRGSSLDAELLARYHAGIPTEDDIHFIGELAAMILGDALAWGVAADAPPLEAPAA